MRLRRVSAVFWKDFLDLRKNKGLLLSMSALPMANRRLSVLGALAVLSLGLILVGRPLLARNLWSIQALRWSSLSPVAVGPLPPPPTGHPRATLWLGRAATRQGDPSAALALLTERHDPLGVRE